MRPVLHYVVSCALTSAIPLAVVAPTALAEADRITSIKPRPFEPALRLAQNKAKGERGDERHENADVPEAVTRENERADRIHEIVVTGTYIRNSDPLSPVITITNEDLMIQGYSRLDQALQQLPQNFKGGFAADSNGITASGITNYSFSSGVNLRGLGSGATLALLNGRRLPATALGDSVDISQIPVSVIDRVEILTDGASATYGSEAIAGVVNVITRNDFEGIHVGLDSTGVARGKAPNYGTSLAAGTGWDGGNIVAHLDYRKSNPLFARNRPFTSRLLNPTTLTPEQDATTAYVAVRQEISDAFAISGDILAASRTYDAEATFAPTPNPLSGKVEQTNISMQLDYGLGANWNSALIAQYAREDDEHESRLTNFSRSTLSDYNYGVSSIEARFDGTVLAIPTGNVRAALGASRRKEYFENTGRSLNLSTGVTSVGANTSANRHVTSAYAEVLVPFVNPSLNIPLVRELRLNIAGRYDDYDDFGSTTNPKTALQWSINDTFQLHGSYAKSFRAPTLYQLDPTAINSAYVFDEVSPAAGAPVRTLYIDATNPSLDPERANSRTFGLTIAPPTMPGFKADVTHFRVDYSQRISRLFSTFFTRAIADAGLLGPFVNLNPSSADIARELNVPGRFVQSMVGSFTPESIQAIAQLGYQNTAVSEVKGFDTTVAYNRTTSHGNWAVDASASYLDSFSNKVTFSAPDFDVSDTIYNPLRFRAKLNVAWARGGWQTNVRLNYADSYSNPNDPVCTDSTDGCAVAAWTTVDLALSYVSGDRTPLSFLGDMRVSATAFNIFDRNPPYTFSSRGVNYDPTNADPLGRSFGLSFIKRWERATDAD